MSAPSTPDDTPPVVPRASLTRILLEALRAKGELAQRFATDDSVTPSSPAENAAASAAIHSDPRAAPPRPLPRNPCPIPDPTWPPRA